MKFMKSSCATLFLSALIITGCGYSEEVGDGYVDEHPEYTEAWSKQFGKIDSKQTFNTAFKAQLNVITNLEGIVKITTIGQEKRTLLHTQKVLGTQDVYFDIPQGIGDQVAVFLETAEGTDFRRVSISELFKGRRRADFSNSEFQGTRSNPLENRSYVGKTENGIKLWGYSTFPGWIWSSLAQAIPEGKMAKDQIHDFSLISNGKFYVSLIYGVTGNNNREIGYYYYPQGQPEQITYVKYVNALKYDYLYDGINYQSADDALCKVQCKLSDYAYWIDCNFDHYDKVGATSNSRFPNHLGDEVYNTLATNQKYGDRIEKIRSLTLQVDAPKDYVVGFWCARITTATTKQSERNHSNQELNVTLSDSNEKLYASVIKIYDGFRFIGLEDSAFSSQTEINKKNGAEPDCNDITLAMVAGNDGTLPGVRLPYIYNNETQLYYNADGSETETPKADVATDGVKKEDISTEIENPEENLIEGLQCYTIGYEDMGTTGDFDFNDVVIRVTPNPVTQKAHITLCATGGSLEAYLYYGDQCLGEVHQLMGVNGLCNTGGGYKTVPEKNLGSVDWPEGYTMSTHAHLFRIKVGDAFMSVPTQQYEVPEAICVAGEWMWPLEGTNIADAYTLFGKWGANYSDSSSWNWYQNPTEDKVYKK